MSFYGQEVSTGAEVIKHHQDYRAARALALVEERCWIRHILAEYPNLDLNVNNIVRDNVNRKHPLRWVPFAPTARNFRQAATERYNFGFSSWNNPHDSEYYSACGYDDYQGELRDEAKAQAIEYFRAWKCLVGKHN